MKEMKKIAKLSSEKVNYLVTASAKAEEEEEEDSSECDSWNNEMKRSSSLEYDVHYVENFFTSLD